MKTILLLTVLLSGVLAITAAPAVGAVEPAEAPVAPEKENQVEAAEPAQEPVEPQEENHVLDMEVEAVPKDGEPEVFSAGKVAAPLEGRLFFCPTGWVRHRNSCYLLVSSSRYWASAATYCSALGASLPSAHDLFEYSFLQGLTTGAGYTTTWMGGLYFQGWRWLDETNFDYQNWYTHNSVSSYPCMYLNSRVGWSNSNCAVSRPFICQKRTDTC